MAAIGVKPLSSRDWLLGSRPRRLALAALLGEPDRSWSKSEVARAAGVSVHGGIDEHVAGLVRVGLLARDGARWRLVVPGGALVAPLTALLAALEALPDDDAPPSRGGTARKRRVQAVSREPTSSTPPPGR